MMVVVPDAVSSSATAMHSTGVSAAAVRENLPVALALSTLAGMSTGLGALVVVIWPDISARRLGMWQGAAAGFMVAVSVADLLPTALADLSAPRVALAATAGAAALLVLRALLPEPDLARAALLPKAADERAAAVLWSGLLTALSIALHNLPEGFAVAAASLRGLNFGAPLALAIGLHNLPEGVAVALPVYYATRSRATAVRLAFLSGLAEPAGVLVLLVMLSVFGDISSAFLAALLASVAGVMTALSAAELFPQARKHCGSRDAVLFTLAGFVTMTALLVGMDRAGMSL